MTLNKIKQTITTNTFKTVLFIHSYLPLLLIIFFLKIDNGKLTFSLMILILISMIVFTRFLNSPTRKKASENLNIKDINKSGTEVLNYFASYILPFVILSFDGIENVMKYNTIIALLLVFLILGVLYTSSNLYYINPLLSMMYEISVCKLKDGKEIIVISSKGKKINIKTSIFMRRIFDNIYLYVDNEKSFRRKNNIILTFFCILLITLWSLKYFKVLF